MEGFVISVLTGACGNLATDVIKKIAKLILSDTALMARLTTAGKAEAEDAILNALQHIVIKANSGTIQIDGASLVSLNNVISDHSSGKISVERSNIHGKSVEIGGTGSGTTEILGGSNLTTSGTLISVGKGCSIRLSGNATIKQS